MSTNQKWTAEKNAALVAAYFDMQEKDNRGEKFSKAAVRRALVAGPLAGHSEGSLEFKFMNVSGCLKALGRLPLRGYAPAMNYQRDLMVAVCARLGIEAQPAETL